MSLGIKQVLDQYQISQGELASALGISRPAINQVVNHNKWPASSDGLRDAMKKFLQDRGIRATGLFKKVAPERANAPGPVSTPNRNKSKETILMLRKVPLHHKARQHFGLVRDPFGDCTEPADIYLNPDYRYVREAMMDKVRHGGFLAVVGESGAGKSTLREELVERLAREQQPVIVITPYVLAMEESDAKGKTLKAQHIAEAIMSSVAPLTSLKSSPEARFLQMHHALRDSARANNRHVLLIEEAHAIPLATLKHLKRFLELKDGMKPLISIILIGQPELAKRLSEQNPEVREVVQRIEICTLSPIDNDIEAYLRHRFQRAGGSLDQVIDRSGIEAIRVRLTTNAQRGASSWVYPLAVHNVLAKAMNAAAEVGAPKVTGDIVRESVR